MQTHLLPPNLLKLFAPRPPLPYLKPTSRDPDLPLKSLSSKRAPQPIVLSTVLKQVKEEKDEAERKALEEGEEPDRVEGEDSGLKGGVSKAKEEELEGKMDVDGEVNEVKEEKEEVKVNGKNKNKKLSTEVKDKKEPPKAVKKEGLPETSEFSLTAEEQFQARRRERQRLRQEAMSKTCKSSPFSFPPLPPLLTLAVSP